MNNLLQTVELMPKSQQLFSIIWLHGLGADGHDFEAIVPALDLLAESHIGFIFPNAPIRSVTINNGMKMPAWYDFLAMSLEHKVDIEGVEQSVASIEQLIQREMDKGIASENILLAGFSQGGVIALHTGLRFPHKLAGIIALSTYLPTLEQIKAEATEANQSIPIFMGHGVMDTAIDIQAAKQAFKDLTGMGYPVQWQQYAMQHSVCQEEIKDISRFINTVIVL